MSAMGRQQTFRVKKIWGEKMPEPPLRNPGQEWLGYVAHWALSLDAPGRATRRVTPDRAKLRPLKGGR